MFIYQKGKGFIPGVPARDLTNAEAREHGVTNSAIYKVEADAASEPEVITDVINNDSKGETDVDSN